MTAADVACCDRFSMGLPSINSIPFHGSRMNLAPVISFKRQLRCTAHSTCTMLELAQKESSLQC